MKRRKDGILVGMIPIQHGKTMAQLGWLPFCIPCDQKKKNPYHKPCGKR